MPNSLKALLVFVIALLGFTPAASAEQTTLRQVGSVEGTFTNGAGILSVENINATFRNVGEVTAESISVTATLPDGKAIALKGPESLERKKSGTYTSTGAEPVSSNKKLKASATCDNCR
jgi:hypothetical protein